MGVPGLRDAEAQSEIFHFTDSNHLEEVEAIQLLGGLNGGGSGASPEELDPAYFSDDEPFPISTTTLSTVSTQPASPRPTPTGALARNEMILYPDSDDPERISTISRRHPLSRESTVRAFVPALSPSALTVMAVSARNNSSDSESDRGDQHDDPATGLGLDAGENDVVAGVGAMVIADHPISKGSVAVRGRAVGARGRKVPGQTVAADSRPTRSGTRTRKTAVQS